MYAIIWRYDVNEANRDRFEDLYGRNGAWARLFSKVEGYLGTELLRSEHIAGEYMTIDRWTSREDFESFKDRFGEEYLALDAACESLTETEQSLGNFEF
jgi:heme-degrading monooxygenase HmoA